MPAPNWTAIGLTDNPFVNVLPGEHLEWVVIDDRVRTALEQPHFRVELIGDKGAGKSTTVRWYAGTHPDCVVVYCRDQPKADQLHLPDGIRTLCLDEANATTPAELKKFDAIVRARGLNLLVSSHWSLAKPLSPIETFQLREVTSLGWVGRRVAAHRTGGETIDFETVAREAWQRSNQVNYAVLRVLYEYAENRARGLAHDAALDDAFRRAKQDATITLR